MRVKKKSDPMRLVWTVKPVTKVVGSKKVYDRNRTKSGTRREYA
jgi:hypothetical protein